MSNKKYDELVDLIQDIYNKSLSETVESMHPLIEFIDKEQNDKENILQDSFIGKRIGCKNDYQHISIIKLDKIKDVIDKGDIVRVIIYDAEKNERNDFVGSERARFLEWFLKQTGYTIEKHTDNESYKNKQLNRIIGLLYNIKSESVEKAVEILKKLRSDNVVRIEENNDK